MKHSLENFLFKAWFEVREWHWVPTTMLCSFLTRLGISYFVVVSARHHRPIITPRPFSSSSSPRVICCDPPDYLSPHHGSVFVSLPGVLWLFVKIISIRWPRVQNHLFSTTSMSRDAVVMVVWRDSGPVFVYLINWMSDRGIFWMTPAAGCVMRLV